MNEDASEALEFKNSVPPAIGESPWTHAENQVSLELDVRTETSPDKPDKSIP